MYGPSRFDDLVKIITGFSGEHPDLVDIGFDHGRLRLDPHFQQFSAGIQDHRFPRFLYDPHQSRVCGSVKSFGNTAGHSHHIRVFHQFPELFFKSPEVFFCEGKSRLQEFCLHMIDFIPDIDAGAAFPFHMVKSAFDPERFQSLFNIISRVSAHKPCGDDFRAVDGGRLGDVQSFAAGNIGTFLYPVHLSHPAVVHHISLVNGRV